MFSSWDANARAPGNSRAPDFAAISKAGSIASQTPVQRRWRTQTERFPDGDAAARDAENRFAVARRGPADGAVSGFGQATALLLTESAPCYTGIEEK